MQGFVKNGNFSSELSFKPSLATISLISDYLPGKIFHSTKGIYFIRILFMA